MTTSTTSIDMMDLQAAYAYFFFQEERGFLIVPLPGVKTCALPIWFDRRLPPRDGRRPPRRGCGALDAARRARQRLHPGDAAVGAREGRQGQIGRAHV